MQNATENSLQILITSVASTLPSATTQLYFCATYALPLAAGSCDCGPYAAGAPQAGGAPYHGCGWYPGGGYPEGCGQPEGGVYPAGG
ncbi:MAG: hypothetical protein EZS28_039849 [Streblomastix strix]|uniref:Uncharacterized protein n=1 Tax=Streblomastix strix TaxID=222440 RepID=A0A5J4U4N6_9EUKA|nr:MAG: hypothetical protein EZS28_039849 [Streblomastix strix]